ncbi:hypothetical protein AAG747_00880 [Rapidithrix thailandica]|uniref:Lipocalin-like domain-containing protein n=1 Tax=Rapidithrix thailandica TaxID=413964 RepID=A0AAW9S251_9BACT
MNRIYILLVIGLTFSSFQASCQHFITGKWVNINMNDVNKPIIYDFREDGILYLHYRADSIKKRKWEVLDGALLMGNACDGYKKLTIKRIGEYKVLLNDDIILTPYHLLNLKKSMKGSFKSFLQENTWAAGKNKGSNQANFYLEVINDQILLQTYPKDTEGKAFPSHLFNWELVEVDSILILGIHGSLKQYFYVRAMNNQGFEVVNAVNNFDQLTFCTHSFEVDIDKLIAQLQGNWVFQDDELYERISFNIMSEGDKSYTLFYNVLPEKRMEIGDYRINKDGRLLVLDDNRVIEILKINEYSLILKFNPYSEEELIYYLHRKN